MKDSNYKAPQARMQKCDCVNEYQDSKYGAGFRVHNPCILPKGLELTAFRCTVCSKEKPI